MKLRTFRFTRWHLTAALLIIPLLAQTFVPILLQHASAGVLTNGTVRFDRMNASQTTTGTVCAKTNATVQTEAAVAVTFPTGYTVSATTGNWTVSIATTTGWPSGAAAWPGITAPSVANQINGQTVQFTNTDLTASTLYCFNWTTAAALTIKGSATTNNTGTITTCSNNTNCASTGSGGGTSGNLDTVDYATASLGNNCGSGAQACDQIYVSATVTPSFAFSLTSNTAALSTLSASSPSSASAINARVSTNAATGWQLWLADHSASAGLHSTNANHTISYSPAAGGAASALSTGNEGFNIGASTVSGTCNGSETYDAAFDNTASTSYKGGGLDGTLRTVVTGAGTASNCDTPLTVNGSISNTTPPASDYAATITVTAAGSF
jgi:hypothetical protein